MRRVLVAFGMLLFGEGVENLLCQAQDITVIKTTSTRGLALANEIKRYQPDVLISDENLQVSELCSMLGMLEDYHELLVIILNTEHNQLTRLDIKETSIADMKDLLFVIRNG